MKSKRFSLVRITLSYLLCATIMVLSTGCMAAFESMVSQAVDRNTNEMVEKAVQPAMQEYTAKATAPQTIEYPIPITAESYFTPVPLSLSLPSEEEERALAQAEEEVRKDRTQSETSGRSPSRLAVSAFDRFSIQEFTARRFEEAWEGMGPLDRSEFRRLIPHEPEFSGTTQDPDRASGLSQSVALAILYGDSQPFKVALAAATLSYDYSNAIAASNFASALAPKGKGTEDVVEVYRHALSCSLNEGAYTSESVPVLINLGNLLLELDKDEEAKQSFLAALDIDPTSWDAAVGLSSYYWNTGFRLKAKAILEDTMLARPAMYAMMATQSKMIEDVAEAIEIPANAPDEMHEQAIETIASQPILTAAEFISSMDQNERNKIRTFIDYLVPEGSYTTPKIDTVLAYGSLQAIRQPHGIAALTDLIESVAMFATKASASYTKDLIEDTERMGLHIDMQGIDLDELEAHPEKYANYTGGEAAVSGEENVYAYVAELEQQAKQAELDLANNRTASSLQIAATLDPAMVIFQINPADYADPSNVLIQRYNMLQYQIKYNAYGKYLDNLGVKMIQTLHSMAQQAGFQLSGLEEKFGGEECREAVTKWNDICSRYWNQMTSYASVQYLKKITPYAKAFYQDVFKHVAMISDPVVRDLKDKELRAAIDRAVLTGLEGVVMAYGAFDYYPVQEKCGEDISRLEAIEQVEEQRQAKNNYEKKRFESGDIPPSSPLFKKLDSYGTDLDIPFVPISGRISVARTDLKLGFDLPMKGNPGFDYHYTKNNFTGKSMHDGSASYRFNAGKGDAQIEGKVSITGKIGFNGDGTVSDYGFGASGEATASYKGAKVTVSGSAMSGSDGMSFTGDASGSFTSSLPSMDEVEIEVAVQRDGSVTIDPQIAFDPIGDLLGDAADQTVGNEGKPFIPTDTEGIKNVFDGKFRL